MAHSSIYLPQHLNFAHMSLAFYLYEQTVFHVQMGSFNIFLPVLGKLLAQGPRMIQIKDGFTALDSPMGFCLNEDS
jgi:hypothetical protein